MNTEKLKVFLIDKETGKQTELPNAIGTIHVSDPEPQPQADGRYSFNVSCKAHISRRNLKHLKRLLTPPRPPKYIPKANIAWCIIENYDPEQRRVKFEKLMSKTHRVLWEDLHKFVRMFGSVRSLHRLLPNIY